MRKSVNAFGRFIAPAVRSRPCGYRDRRASL
jgi:hypothetical protein